MPVWLRLPSIPVSISVWGIRFRLSPYLIFAYAIHGCKSLYRPFKRFKLLVEVRYQTVIKRIGAMPYSLKLPAFFRHLFFQLCAFGRLLYAAKILNGVIACFIDEDLNFGEEIGERTIDKIVTGFQSGCAFSTLSVG